jgi:uncharacterized protein (TIRG00374 family)
MAMTAIRAEGAWYTTAPLASLSQPMSPTDSRSSESGRRVWLWILKIGVSSGLLYLVFRQLDVPHMLRLMRDASFGWIVVALLIYLVMLAISTWRWRLLLGAQAVTVPFRVLFYSFLVAIFANNFLPSNIGGDVIRIRDTARAAGSKTLATTVVLADRGLGVLGLAFVASMGSTLAARRSEALGPLGPALLWGGLLTALVLCWLVLAFPERLGVLARPLRTFHAEWVDKRTGVLTQALVRFRRAPLSMLLGFLSAIAVQASLVVFYLAVAAALHVQVPFGHLAILVPVSFIVQMLPVSLNGLGLREATFGVYLTKVGVKLESAVALSFIGAALVMIFSMSGAAAYLARRDMPVEPEVGD